MMIRSKLIENFDQMLLDERKYQTLIKSNHGKIYDDYMITNILYVRISKDQIRHVSLNLYNLYNILIDNKGAIRVNYFPSCSLISKKGNQQANKVKIVGKMVYMAEGYFGFTL